MGKLRDQMLADLQLCGAKPRTQETYLREAENLAKYFNRSPAELRENELKEYLLYLIKERHLSKGTFRFYVAGLKFLYRTTLKREWPAEKIKHPKRRRKLPIVLDLSEVESLFSVTKNLKHSFRSLSLTSICQLIRAPGCGAAGPWFARFVQNGTGVQTRAASSRLHARRSCAVERRRVPLAQPAREPSVELRAAPQQGTARSGAISALDNGACLGLFYSRGRRDNRRQNAKETHD